MRARFSPRAGMKPRLNEARQQDPPGCASRIPKAVACRLALTVRLNDLCSPWTVKSCGFYFAGISRSNMKSYCSLIIKGLEVEWSLRKVNIFFFFNERLVVKHVNLILSVKELR